MSYVIVYIMIYILKCDVLAIEKGLTFYFVTVVKICVYWGSDTFLIHLNSLQ